MMYARVLAAATMLVLALPAVAQDGAPQMRRDQNRIMFSSYPPDALKRKEEGSVGVAVRTDRNGTMTDCEVTRSSGFPSLDRASCAMLLAYGRTKPFLSADGRRVQHAQDGTVVWRLPDGRGASAEAVTASAISPIAGGKQTGGKTGERMICKRQSTTGSMVTTTRVCMSKSDWDRELAATQQQLREYKPGFQNY
jgi:protein TonB